MPRYTYDHIHLRTRDPMAMAQYFNKMFDAKIVESIQSDGQPRIDIDLDGLVLFIAQALPNADIPVLPSDPFNWIASTYLGVDHFGLRVDNIDDIVSELKNRGAEIAVEPQTLRPGVRIAFIQAPDNVRIELIQRD